MEDDSHPPAQGPEARVLLADDSDVEREALAHLLRQAGYQVDEADDGEAAILFLKQKLPDLLLLDLQMPGMNGPSSIADKSPVHGISGIIAR